MKLWMLLPCAVLLPISQSYAGIGNITEQSNTPPAIQRKTQSITGAKGTSVEMMDSIRTAQGKVGITFDDNTKVQVNENSKLIIDDFVYDPKKGSGKIALNMALGTVRYASGQIAKNDPQKVALNTPTATVSVRGTDFTATVDEMGASTFVLLPSCPQDRQNRTVKDIEANCKTGSIIVESDAGQVILNQPFQATKVISRNQPPTRPVVLSLSEDAMSNMLIISPPKEIRRAEQDQKMSMNPLNVDFLKFDGLNDVLSEQILSMFGKDILSRNYLEANYLSNLFEQMGSALDEDFLKDSDNVLPDYRKSSGVVAFKDDLTVTLCRDNGDVICVTTPNTQSSLVTQQQGSVVIKNRINQGGNTIITLIQK